MERAIRLPAWRPLTVVGARGGCPWWKDMMYDVKISSKHNCFSMLFLQRYGKHCRCPKTSDVPVPILNIFLHHEGLDLTRCNVQYVNRRKNERVINQHNLDLVSVVSCDGVTTTKESPSSTPSSRGRNEKSSDISLVAIVKLLFIH